MQTGLKKQAKKAIDELSEDKVRVAIEFLDNLKNKENLPITTTKKKFERRSPLPPQKLEITTTKAMSIFKDQGHGKITRATIISWIRKYKLGVKIGGHWYVKRKKFEKFLKKGASNVAE